jgi:predicted regulator of Ras-like GTPase activity (Roadblock/LC7/MglB family)
VNAFPKSGSTQLADVLAGMNAQGGYTLAVLTDRHGFPIAWSAAAGQDPELPSAVVALVQKTAGQVREQLGMAQTDEIALRHSDGRLLVCRPFDANGHELILAVLVAGRHTSYRRLTNQAVSAIQRLWRL